MNVPVLWKTLRRLPLGRPLIQALFVLAAVVESPVIAAPAPKEDPSYFFSVAGARDCAYDEKRQKLYVTTLKQLVVIDTKARKVLDSIDLLGSVQGCAISPDFEYLALAPAQGQFIYSMKLIDMEISQVKFKADASETGVHDLCFGQDNSVLFSMKFAGSGWVKLRRFDPKKNTVDPVGNIRMDSVVTASGDRRYAAVAEGNISSGDLQLFDFQEKTLKKVAGLNCFHFEMACSKDASYFARPHGKGCDLYDGKGARLGTLEGKPGICAAFHPRADVLFLMRHGELSIEEYDIQGKKSINEYPLDSPLVIKGDVNDRVVGQLIPVGRDTVIGNFRRVVNVNYRTFESGRLKVSETGGKLLAVVPTGVYLFPVKTRVGADAVPPKVRIKVIETDPSPNP